MSKIFQVQSSNDKNIDLKQALELAQKTGTLKVPESALCLTIASGIPVEMEGEDGEK